MNRNSLSKKELVVAVILLFISVSAIPSTGICVGNIDCNNPPTAPIFLGPTRGVVGEGCHYTINSTDPDGDDIYYVVLWEPGVIYEWFGPYPSGEEVNIGHTWDERGTYYVFSAAMDIHYDESDFTILEVIIGEIIYVDDDNIEGPWNGTIEYPYQYIQDGIDNAFEYDTVFVYNGTYYENVLVDKSINLIGENKETTVIDGGNEDVVYISANWVNISGFTIQNSGVWLNGGIKILDSNHANLSNNIISYNGFGIYLINSNDTLIEKNTFCFNSAYCIFISQSNNNYILDNEMTDNTGSDTIYLWYSNNNYFEKNIIFDNTGTFYCSYACNNTIIDNTIQNCKSFHLASGSNNNQIINNNYSNNNDGIYISGNDNLFLENIISNNDNISCGRTGLYFKGGSHNNIVMKNNIMNHHCGINIYDSAYDNIIYNNNFINNTYNARDVCSNTWDNGYPSGGNYWDDYIGKDNDGDGIGDIPYNISGGNNQDRYPLMEPFVQYPEFDVSGCGGIGLKISITNVGDIVATNVEWSVSVKGGLFGLINLSENGSLNSLDVGESISLTLMPFGLGLLTVRVKIDASHAEKQTFKGSFFVILFIVFPTIPPLCWSSGQIIHRDNT